MQITAEQMERYSRALMSAFEATMATHLRGRFPALLGNVSDDKLGEAIRFAVKKGNGYGIELQEDLRRFAEFLFAHGGRFDEDPKYASVTSVLRDHALCGTEKMDRIDALEIDLVGRGR